MDALKIANLVKTYTSGTKALEGVSLAIPQGEFFALLGPNGAGKTTLIGTIVGLVNKTSGSVSVNGLNLDTDPERARVAVGIVPQELNFNIFEKTFDIVVNQAGYYGIPRSEAIPRAHELLDALGLGDKKFERSMNLSGGMKRRLMIARALIHKPSFLILDEPTAGVDVELRRGMWDFLTKVNAEGVTILLTTHYLEEAEQLCKRAAIINKGKIIAEGSMKELLGRLKTERIILDLALPKAEEALRVVSAYNPSLVDATTIEIEIGEGRGVSGAMVALDAAGIPVQTTRGKSGKLEEVFVNLTKETV